MSRALPPTAPFAIEQDSWLHPGTGETMHSYRLRDRYQRSVGSGEGTSKADALARASEYRIWLEANS